MYLFTTERQVNNGTWMNIKQLLFTVVGLKHTLSRIKRINIMTAGRKLF